MSAKITIPVGIFAWPIKAPFLLIRWALTSMLMIVSAPVGLIGAIAKDQPYLMGWMPRVELSDGVAVEVTTQRYGRDGSEDYSLYTLTIIPSFFGNLYGAKTRTERVYVPPGVRAEAFNEDGVKLEDLGLDKYFCAALEAKREERMRTTEIARRVAIVKTAKPKNWPKI